MKFRIEHMGAIKKMDLDLSKRLIVFCGPNGTGKTYAAYAVFGFLDTLLIGYPMFSLEELIKKKNLMVELDYERLYRIKQGYVRYLESNVDKIFGVDKGLYFKGFKARLIDGKEDFQQEVHASAFSYVYSYDSVKIKYVKESNSDILHLFLCEPVSLNNDETVEIFHCAHVAKYICHNMVMNAHILPVERNSVYTFISELTVKNIENKALATDEAKTRYPLAIRRALQYAGDLSNIRKDTSEYASLAMEIEHEILQGKMLISDNGELMFLSDKCSEKELPIHLSASIIKNLSGLLVYLKHLAKRNDLLIIDEPEIGLHPDNQILLTRILVKLVNAGIRILISTHSDYIIRELNNLIMLSGVKRKDGIKELLPKFGYNEVETISPDEVGAYLFDYSGGDEVEVKNIPVGKEGFEVATIDRSIRQLNDWSVELFMALNE